MYRSSGDPKYGTQKSYGVDTGLRSKINPPQQASAYPSGPALTKATT